MSILTFLFFASVVYFAAADPIAEPAAAAPIEEPTAAAPIEEPTAAAEAVSDQEQLNKFMTSLEKLYDEQFAPLLKDLSEEDREYMKITTMDGVSGFMNYCLYRAKQQSDEDSGKAFDDDIIMQFDAVESLMSAMAARQPPPCYN